MTNKDILDCLYTDLLMLQDGSWDPHENPDGCEAAIDNIIQLGENLGITPEDTRDNDLDDN